MKNPAKLIKCDDKSLVSIVLPTYNGERFIAEQLRSLQEQTYRNLEIIVIDDVSKDRTVEIVRGLAEKDPRICLNVNLHNLGLFANYLKGAAMARGEFVCVCDQDDWWRADRVEILKGLLERDSANMFAYSDIEVTDEKLKPIGSSRGLNETRLRGGDLKEFSLFKNVTTHNMIRKMVNDELVKASASAPFAHDHLMLVLAAGMGKIVRSPEKLLKYRQHSGNAIGAFYPSVLTRERTVRELNEKSAYVKRMFPGLKLDLQRLGAFCDALEAGGTYRRTDFIEYFLYLRNDTLKDRILALVDCLFPRFYTWLSSKKSTKGANL